MNIASLFNLAGPDLIIILLIVLLLFGAKKLPELAKGMGQAVREFTKAKDEFEREVSRPTAPTEEVVQHLDPPPKSETARDEGYPHGDQTQEKDPVSTRDAHGDPTQEVPHTPQTTRVS